VRSSSIGGSVMRAEDPPLLRGTATFAGDVRLQGLATMVVVRSQGAHGIVSSIDVSEALAMPGVLAIWTADDIRADLGEVPCISPRLSETPRAAHYLQPVLAERHIRYVGEPVAVVLAEDRYTAEDAAEMVFVDVDPLPAVLDARGPHPYDLFPQGNEVQVLHALVGDPHRILREASIVIESPFEIGRHSAIPMETRSLTVDFPTAENKLAIYGSTKVPHWNRRELARQLKIGVERIVMKETSIGGGFGVRGEFYPEDFLTAWCAMKLGRPIAWAEDRRENFISTNHARQQHHLATIAGDSEGNVLALRTEFWLDLGAYVRTNGLRVPENTVTWMPGPYDIEHYQGIAHCVVTNKTPTATYRAPGGVECTFVRERLLDMYAERVGMDPIDLRRKNLISKSQMPYERKTIETVPSIVLDEGDFHHLFERVVGRLDIDEVNRRRARGELVGYGVSTFFERSGAGPFERGSVAVDRTGAVTVRSGASSVGQGLRTVLSQIVADVLDVPPGDIVVELLDTEKTDAGVGSFGSRSTMTAGAAVMQAAHGLLAQAKTHAAALLGSTEEAITFRNGRFTTDGAVPGLDLRAVASASGPEQRLEVEADFKVSGPIYDFGAHGAVARVDRDTGAVTIEQLVVGFDVGKAINPKLVEGQFVGAAAQGVGGALLEELVFDEHGNPLVTSLMDYLMPTASEVPPIEAIIDESHPTDHNPLGAKGAGEGGITGVPAAISGAVAHAVSDQASITRIPVDPSLLLGAPGTGAAALEKEMLA